MSEFTGKFKVDDEVKVIDESWGEDVRNSTGVVVEVREHRPYPYKVTLKDHPDVWEREGWLFLEQELELV